MTRIKPGDDLRLRTRAAVTLLNGQPRKREDLELAAFLDLFHPEIPAEKQAEMVREKRRNMK